MVNTSVDMTIHQSINQSINHISCLYVHYITTDLNTGARADCCHTRDNCGLDLSVHSNTGARADCHACRAIL